MYCECGEFLLSFILNNFFPFFSGVIAKLSERGKETRKNIGRNEKGKNRHCICPGSQLKVGHETTVP